MLCCNFWGGQCADGRLCHLVWPRVHFLCSVQRRDGDDHRPSRLQFISMGFMEWTAGLLYAPRSRLGCGVPRRERAQTYAPWASPTLHLFGGARRGMSSRGHGKGERRYRGGAGRRRLCKRVSDGGSRESPRMCVARRASLSYTTHRAARAATTVERRVGAAGDGQGGEGQEAPACVLCCVRGVASG